MAIGKKTGGRIEGTPNKLTKDVRIVLKELIFRELEELPDRLIKLEPMDRLDILVKLLPTVYPK